MVKSRIYRTVQGDSFDSIACRLWKNERLCGELMRANAEYMDVLIFEAGIELAVPEVKAPKKIADLPPWYEKTDRHQFTLLETL